MKPYMIICLLLLFFSSCIITENMPQVVRKDVVEPVFNLSCEQRSLETYEQEAFDAAKQATGEEECHGAMESFERDLCYMKIAIHRNDSTFCGQIENCEPLAFCKNNFN